MSSPELVISAEPRPSEAQYLEDRIYEFNSSATGITDGEWLAIFVRDENHRNLPHIRFSPTNPGEHFYEHALWLKEMFERRSQVGVTSEMNFSSCRLGLQHYVITYSQPLGVRSVEAGPIAMGAMGDQQALEFTMMAVHLANPTALPPTLKAIQLAIPRSILLPRSSEMRWIGKNRRQCMAEATKNGLRKSWCHIPISIGVLIDSDA